jgi:pilus assembly protein CpaD
MSATPNERRPRLLVATLALAAVAGACASRPPAPGASLETAPSAADRHRIVVQSVDERLELPVPQGASALDTLSQRATDEFGSLYASQGAGVLSIMIPKNSANAQEARTLADAAYERLIAAGASSASVSLAYYDGSGQTDPGLVVSFSRFSAQAPVCAPIFENNLAHDATNRPWDSFGCATQSNLAAMAAHPQDLLGPRTEIPVDAARRGAVLEKYREGGQTHATRSTDERVTISDAVR